MYSWGGLNDDREVLCEVTLLFAKQILAETGKKLNILEDTIERKPTVISSSMNALKLGMFHRRSVDHQQQASTDDSGSFSSANS